MNRVPIGLKNLNSKTEIREIGMARIMMNSVNGELKISAIKTKGIWMTVDKSRAARQCKN
jgi:hypothetical protein